MGKKGSGIEYIFQVSGQALHRGSAQTPSNAQGAAELPRQCLHSKAVAYG